MTNSAAITQIWIDDYLDLLNYAVQIGDSAWKEEIVQTLKQMNVPDYNPVQELKVQLWQQYDAVIHEMLAVYERLRKSTANEDRQAEEALWNLKQRRLYIARQLKRI
ncbi:hypothetical protein [Paenibacillus beijingensis]|uniref:Uncharacterized protein n=1 Tax=Paenibacillus beijingensis TaxID=1126833 RepID=A0A0D5NEU3_9BACL|nr:hypothetical protein [Paenibacillus beijingensis]AJY73909.1 hypothetical protein VN24_03885 [Paenibacillus beijingensis]